MHRRDALRSLLGTSAAFTLSSCTRTSNVTDGLSDADIGKIALALTGITLKPGQAAGVRELLLAMRFKRTVDSRVQPSLVFDPEVDVE